MKEKIKILDLETRPSQETDLLKLSQDDQKKVVGGIRFASVEAYQRWLASRGPGACALLGWSGEECRRRVVGWGWSGGLALGSVELR
ncbi:MAG: hypothetical protein F6J90_04710 [Moorea sp. SIOASIH]|uniref:hypothetical protein n=1 Tax=Moorena sp. SIOASIH TaxID=2607817 RepID=UPI0013BD61E2|nr:hypothetical protein [Moorena sp. SIOASIH]NEO35657.1 hypothetical protein [Moorena sp. SIOASIH]